MAARGDDPLRIMQRAGHQDFAATQIYIREAENLGAVFPPCLPTYWPANRPPNRLSPR
ncbi:MAG TPA: hypothetical protein VH044_19595 [Polyangiaceae bacterium]|jgi:hypothetical protein|nr:hypothetical protein [Polyangiaceae bacterium]